MLRYVECDTLVVRKDLVCFNKCDAGTSGVVLAEKITCTLEGLGLDLADLHGQAYNGRENMAGVVNGASTIRNAQYPLAMYLHCASHCLNLTVVKSLEVTSVHNMMGESTSSLLRILNARLALRKLSLTANFFESSQVEEHVPH